MLLETQLAHMWWINRLATQMWAKWLAVNCRHRVRERHPQLVVECRPEHEE